jgi:hypothetical protein
MKSLDKRITLNLAGKRIFESLKIKYLGVILDKSILEYPHYRAL